MSLSIKLWVGFAGMVEGSQPTQNDMEGWAHSAAALEQEIELLRSTLDATTGAALRIEAEQAAEIRGLRELKTNAPPWQKAQVIERNSTPDTHGKTFGDD